MYIKRLLQSVPCFLLLSLISSFAQGQTLLEDSIMNGRNFEKAAFRLWIGDQTEKVKGIIVLVPGSNGDGRNMIESPSWQALANKNGMALLGCNFRDKRSPNMAIEQYADVKNGSGQAMLDVISRMSISSGHAELDNAPIALWGMSAGGEFNYEFAVWKPGRVIAFVVNKGGVYYSALAPKATRAVPGIFLTGEVDNPYRNNIVKGIYSVNRRFGAKWMFAEEPGIGHEFTDSEAFVQDYFAQIIPMRLADNGKLKPMTQLGYIGNNDTQEILEVVKNQRVRGVTSWFPNKKLAERWLELIR